MNHTVNLNQKDILIFLKNLFGTKRTVSIDSDTILNYKLFRFLFLPFFYSSTLSVFDIKMNIECKGVRSIYCRLADQLNSDKVQFHFYPRIKMEHLILRRVKTA